MVFQEESIARRFWPFRRASAAKGDKYGDQEAGWDAVEEDKRSTSAEWGHCFESWRRRASPHAAQVSKPNCDDLAADCAERGGARELVGEFVHPLRRANKLFRFQVESTDQVNFRFFTESGEFLMYAFVSMEAGKVSFHTYDPEAAGPTLFDASRPAFTMTCNRDRSEWLLVQERCESCTRRHENAQCSCAGLCKKQQVAFISHSRKEIGGGVFNCMEAVIPGFLADGSSDVRCPWECGDLATAGVSSSSGSSPPAVRLATQEPVWNEEVDSLVLDFRGRQVQPSTRNFQLRRMDDSGNRTVCQFAKIGDARFSLDFRHPLGAIQAFGISMSTLLWD